MKARQAIAIIEAIAKRKEKFEPKKQGNSRTNRRKCQKTKRTCSKENNKIARKTIKRSKNIRTKVQNSKQQKSNLQTSHSMGENTKKTTEIVKED